MNLVAAYCALLEISRQMLALAEKQQWEALTVLESQRAGMIGDLQKSAGYTGSDTEEIAALIQQIQALDEEIQGYVLPWQTHAATLLERFRPSTSETT